MAILYHALPKPSAVCCIDGRGLGPPRVPLTDSVAVATGAGGSSRSARWLTEARDTIEHGDTIEVWMAGAYRSPFPTRAGVGRRNFVELGIRGLWTLASTPAVRLTYFVDLIPFALSTGNPQRYERRPCDVHPAECYSIMPVVRPTVAVGLAPVGFRVTVQIRLRLSLESSASGGVLAFSDRVPDPDARRLNLTAAIGGGLAVPLSARTGLAVGYVLHHTSNASTARANPGMNLGR